MSASCPVPPTQTTHMAVPAIDVPPQTIEKWQKAVDLICRLADVPAALVMRIDREDIEVYVSSRSPGNPYHVGEREHLANSGLYCEHVIRKRERLLVPNALADPNWSSNPDIRLGLISYLGFPILRPGGEVFGTLCVLDRKENRYSTDIEDLMLEFKDLLETHLDLLDKNQALEIVNSELRRSLDEASRLSRELETAATTDPLTRLMNRRTFDVLIQHIQARQRRSGKPTCFVLADLDHFKRLNDSLGHQAGDRALQHIASLFRSRLREQDMVWRWGGEEFLMVLPETPLDGALAVADSLRSRMSETPFICGEGKHTITMSVGVTALGPEESPDRCLARCDILLYQAKNLGRNRVVGKA